MMVSENGFCQVQLWIRKKDFFGAASRFVKKLELTPSALYDFDQ